MTLQEVLNKYDRAAEFFTHEMIASRKSANTVESQNRAVRLFRDFFENLHANDEEVSDPKYTDFQAWRDRMEEDGKTVNTIHRYMNDVRHFFAVVSDEGLEDIRFYEKNPCHARVIPNNRKEEARPYDVILEDDDVAKLWRNNPVRGQGIKTGTWARDYAIVMVLLATEIRNAELLDLKLSDVDFEYKEIQVQRGKGNKYRCVDCPDIALTAIQLYLESGYRPKDLSDDDYLFGNFRTKGTLGRTLDGDEWNRGSRQWLSKLVMQHVKKVTGVDNVSSHDLRHVGARLDLHNGMRPEELQAKLGHSSYNTTQVYAGKLGSSRKRVTASRVYEEREIQTARNKMMMGA